MIYNDRIEYGKIAFNAIFYRKKVILITIYNFEVKIWSCIRLELSYTPSKDKSISCLMLLPLLGDFAREGVS